MTRRFVNTLSDGDQVEEVFFLADRQIRVATITYPAR